MPAMTAVVLKAESLVRGFSWRSVLGEWRPGVVTRNIGEFVFYGGVVSSGHGVFLSIYRLDTIEPLLEFNTKGVEGSALPSSYSPASVIFIF